MNRDPLQGHENRSHGDCCTHQKKRSLLSYCRPTAEDQEQDGQPRAVTSTHVRGKDLWNICHARRWSIGSPFLVNLRDIGQKSGVSCADYYRYYCQRNPKRPRLPEKLPSVGETDANAFG